MRFLIYVLITCFCFPVIAQNTEVNNTNAELQARLARLETQSSESISMELGTAVTELIEERDSLRTELELEQTRVKILLSKLQRSQNKLAAAEYRTERLLEDSAQFASLTGIKWSGYYVVLETEGDYASAEQRMEYMMAQNSKLELVIRSNQVKTWFYICDSKPYDKGEVGLAVKNYRVSGFKDAWWIGVKAENEQ